MNQNCVLFLDNYYLLIPYGVGIVILAFICYHAAYMIFIFAIYKFCPVSNSKIDKIKSYGDWAVITGTTDGIGKCFAEKLASRKFNLFLISRNEEKLLKQSQELRENYGILVRYFVADFRKTKIYDEIGRQLVGLPIGLLINNVGVAYPSPDFLTANHLSNRDFVDMLHCNCLSTVLMTKTVLQLGMLARGGVIVNLSSASSFIDTPVLSMYAACKAMVNSFSSCIQAEIIVQQASDRVFIQDFTPFWVISKLSGMRRKTFLVPKTDEFVDSCLRQLCRNHHSFGYITHCYENWYLNRLLPKFLRNIIVRNNMLDLRDRAALKRERMKEE